MRCLIMKAWIIGGCVLMSCQSLDAVNDADEPASEIIYSDDNGMNTSPLLPPSEQNPIPSQGSNMSPSSNNSHGGDDVLFPPVPTPSPVPTPITPATPPTVSTPPIPPATPPPLSTEPIPEPSRLICEHTDGQQIQFGPYTEEGQPCDLLGIITRDDNQITGFPSPESNDSNLVDGHQVSGCVTIDFGTVCEPQGLALAFRATESTCGDMSSNQQCVFPENYEGSVSADSTAAVLAVFVSESTEQNMFRIIERLYIALNSVEAQLYYTSDISDEQLRYVMFCRLDCGKDAYNIEIDEARLVNE